MDGKWALYVSEAMSDREPYYSCYAGDTHPTFVAQQKSRDFCRWISCHTCDICRATKCVKMTNIDTDTEYKVFAALLFCFS